MITKIRILHPDRFVENVDVDVALRSIVPAEVPALWGRVAMSAIEAQVIAARTYLLYAANKCPRHIKNSADVCTSPRCCLNFNMSKQHVITNDVIAKTSGKIITYNGELIDAVWSACCGGHTRDNDAVWSAPAVWYLRGVSCVNFDIPRGHGVGLCQLGARDMSLRGATAEEILKHYYTGVEVENYVRP